MGGASPVPVAGNIPQKGEARFAGGPKIEPVAATRGRISSSAARPLSALEASDLIATAAGLPESWCVRLEPPHGQLAILPLSGRRRYHRAWIAARRYSRIGRDDALDLR